MNIEEEFDQFFEFPTDDRSTVSSVSAKLFAKYCVDKYIAELRQKSQEADHGNNG